jgi:hypothetical protein
MSKKQAIKPDNAKQSARFVETARKLGADESGKAFERAIGAVVKPKPSARPARPSSKR